VSVEEIRRFLASDAGVRLRRLLAAGAVVSAPLLFRVPLLRRYPLLRALEMAGGAALIVKLAEQLRDWDPDHPRPIVLEVEPPGPAPGPDRATPR
jgi:hypothetical protein